jgi:hypothetical protein
MAELNPNAKKWVEALRSGKYEQGRNRLKTAHNEFCCLGVACELAIEAGVIREYEGCNSFLSLPVVRWLGLNTGSGAYMGGALHKDNDNGSSFLEIADIIESQPDGLFEKVTA